MATGQEKLDAFLATAREEITRAAPDAATAAEGEAYLMRVLTATLTDIFLPHLQTERGLSRPLPVKGAPNPDYLLRHARVEAGREYRLEGRLNASERVGVGLYAFDAGGAALLEDYAVFNGESADAEGRFSLALGPNPEPGGLTITPDCRVMIARILHRDPEGDPARLSFIGGDDAPGLAEPAGGAEAALERAGQMTLAGVRQFLEWSRLTSTHANAFMEPPEAIAEAARGDPDTCYFLGYYELGEGEWLDVELPDPEATYWSLHAYNHWGEPLPGAGVHDRNARAEPDGRIRVAVGPAPPGDAPNPVATRGRLRGMLIFRAVGGSAAGVPQASRRTPATF